MESFRVLIVTQLESCRVLILTQLESFRVLILSQLESFRALRLMIVTNGLPIPCRTAGCPKAMDGHHMSA